MSMKTLLSLLLTIVNNSLSVINYIIVIIILLPSTLLVLLALKLDIYLTKVQDKIKQKIKNL
jgi:hypothetical protein